MRENPLITLLDDLVAIPSVNPAFGGPGEWELGEFVKTWLMERGLQVTTQTVAERRENVIARCGSRDKPTLLFDAHMDTVGVEGWESGSPYELLEREGRYYGRGACDTKASLAVFMELAATLARAGDDAVYSLLFAATVDEENEQSGAYQLARLKDEYGVIGAVAGEPTRSNIVNQHKGVCRYRMTFDGKSAHGSTPELGENAIVKASDSIGRIQSLISEIDLGPESEMLERATLNIGAIHGGIGFNVVPDHCEFDIDRRLGVQETPEKARTELEAILSDIVGSELITMLERPPLVTDCGNWFSKAMLDAATSVDSTLSMDSVAYMTNAVAYSEMGIPALVFGPGDIAQAHKKDEFIRAGEMERSLAILLKLFGVKN